MFKSISKFINSHAIGQMFELGEKTAAWKKVRELKAGMRIAVANSSGYSHERPEGVEWDEIVSIKKLPPERVWDIEVEGAHNFVGNGIVAHNTSGILMRAGASSLQLSSSAASTTADIQLAAADRIDLFAGSLSLQTSSTTAGELKLMSKGSLILDTSGGTGDVVITKLTTLGYVCTTAGGVLSSGATCSTSDIQLKTDVRDLSQDMNVLESLEKLRGVSFTWDAGNPANAGAPAGRQVGMIAQEVEQVLPSLVTIGSDGYRRLDYGKMTGYLVEVAKAQASQISDLRLQISDLTISTSGIATSSALPAAPLALDTSLATKGPTFYGSEATPSATSYQLSATGSTTDLDSLRARVTQLEDLVALLAGFASPELLVAQAGANTLSTSASALTMDGSNGTYGAYVSDVQTDANLGGNTSGLLSPEPKTNTEYLILNTEWEKSGAPFRMQDSAFSIQNSVFSILSSATIGGSLTVGLVTIDDLDASINSMGENLKIQNQALADIEFLGGKIVMTKTGDMEIKGDLTVFGDVNSQSVTTGEVKILGVGKTIGEGVIPAGSTKVMVESPAVTTTSRIFTQVTASDSFVNFQNSPEVYETSLLLVRKLPSQGFEVTIPAPAATDMTFDYWIIQEE